MVARDGIPRRANRPDNESHQHARRRDQEELAPADLVHKETHGQRHNHVHDLETAIDQVLLNGASISDRVQNLGNIVRHQAVARPLREKPSSNADDQTVPVALGADQLHPAVALKFLLEADSLLDLMHLQLNNLVLLVSIRVTVGQHL